LFGEASKTSVGVKWFLVRPEVLDFLKKAKFTTAEMTGHEWTKNMKMGGAITYGQTGKAGYVVSIH
jgi:hypothetical protein